MSFTRNDIEFPSGGLRCTAWLYRPDADGLLPLVVMAHGFSGTREKRLDAYAERFAQEENLEVEWERIWSIEPRPFDPKLIALCEEAVRETTGDAPRLPSGPLHDAAEMVPHMPVVMMFAYSSNGLSHCKEEDTPEPHLLKTIEAFLLLVKKVVAA